MNWKLAIVVAGVAIALLTSSLFVMAETPVSTGSPYEPHAQIRIMGDSQFTAANGVRSGTGDASNPFVIEGWEFSRKAITAIIIQNTTKHYIIRDISILAPQYPSVPGIILKNSMFAQIANVSIDGRSVGVKVEVFPGAEPNRDIFVMNSRITNCPVGVQINDTGHVVIQNNTISAGIDAGILLKKCVAAEISDNIIRDSARHGKQTVASIHIEKCNGTSISRNRVLLSNDNGIEMNGSADSSIIGNTFEGVAYAWLKLTHSSGAEVRDNIARGLGNNSLPLTSSGLTVINATDCRVESNDLINSSIYMDTVGSGSVLSNRLTNGTGIGMVNCSNSTVTGNRLIGIEAPDSMYYDWHALRILTSENMTVEDNVVQAREGDNGGVLQLEGLDYSFCAHNVLLSGNSSATDHLTGRATEFDLNMMDRVALQVSGNNLTIDANNLTDSTLTIETLDSTITNNSLWAASELSQNHLTKRTAIYHNDFMAGAKVTTTPVAGNSWDDGYPSGGNYWADNASVDDFGGVGQNVSGADGIGDSNVTVPGGAKDRYPLMAPVHPADTLAPISSVIVTGPRGTNGWFVGPVTVTMKANDDSSGIASRLWRLDGGAWTAYTNAIDVQDQGSHLLEYYSVDRNTNTEQVREVRINIDSTDPTVEVTAPAQGTWLHRSTMLLRWSSADSTSGIAYDVVIAEGWKNSRPETNPYLLMTSLPPMHYTMHVTATDDAGNTAESSVVFVITYEQALTSWHGPWGALFNLALLSDFLAGLAGVFFMTRYRAPVSGPVE